MSAVLQPTALNVAPAGVPMGSLVIVNMGSPTYVKVKMLNTLLDSAPKNPIGVVVEPEAVGAGHKVVQRDVTTPDMARNEMKHSYKLLSGSTPMEELQSHFNWWNEKRSQNAQISIVNITTAAAEKENGELSKTFDSCCPGKLAALDYFLHSGAAWSWQFEDDVFVKNFTALEAAYSHDPHDFIVANETAELPFWAEGCDDYTPWCQARTPALGVDGKGYCVDATEHLNQGQTFRYAEMYATRMSRKAGLALHTQLKKGQSSHCGLMLPYTAREFSLTHRALKPVHQKHLKDNWGQACESLQSIKEVENSKDTILAHPVKFWEPVPKLGKLEALSDCMKRAQETDQKAGHSGFGTESIKKDCQDLCLKHKDAA